MSTNTISPKRPLLTDNAAAAAAVQHLLRTSVHQPLHRLRCECTHDAIVLRGCVTSYYIKQLAQEVARKVDDTLAIVNEIKVDTCS